MTFRVTCGSYHMTFSGGGGFNPRIKASRINKGFSPGGMLPGSFIQNQAFFRSL